MRFGEPLRSTEYQPSNKLPPDIVDAASKEIFKFRLMVFGVPCLFLTLTGWPTIFFNRLFLPFVHLPGCGYLTQRKQTRNQENNKYASTHALFDCESCESLCPRLQQFIISDGKMLLTVALLRLTGRVGAEFPGGKGTGEYEVGETRGQD